MNSLNRSLSSFRFGDESFPSLGITTIYLSTPSGIPSIPVSVHVVKPGIPALLGMDILGREQLTPDTAYNRLAKRHQVKQLDGRTVYIEEWYVPMRRSKSRHSYVPLHIPNNTHFSRSQLHTLHRQFFYPSADKLYKLLQKARHEDTTPETKKILEDLTNRCDPCQKIRGGTTRFRVSFGAEDTKFSERILIDIMYLGNDPVLHIVDEGTRFSAATFLSSCSSEVIWKSLLKCWATIYTGLPNRILVDQGSELGKSGIFASLAPNAMSNLVRQGQKRIPVSVLMRGTTNR